VMSEYPPPIALRTASSAGHCPRWTATDPDPIAPVSPGSE
jgi:hypothetical protein